MAATVFTLSYAAIGSGLTITLDSLGNNAYRQSTEVDNSTLQFLDAHVQLIVGTTNTGVNSAGTVFVYAFGQVGDARPFRTDTMGSADAAVDSPGNAPLIGVLRANSNSAIYAGGPFSVAQAFGGFLPYKWGIVVGNSSGAAFTNSASINQIFFLGIQGKGV